MLWIQSDGVWGVAYWIGGACIAASILGAIYACIATWTLALFTRRRAAESLTFPSVSLLKPLHGDEPGLYDNLRSFCVQDYPGALQIVLGVQDPEDPAIAVVRRLQAAYPALDIVLTIGAVGQGGNRKIANLTNMAPKATAEVFIISDSDVRVAPDHIRRVVGALQAPQVGLITCLYRGRPTGGLWSTLAAMDVDYRFAPSVGLALKFGLAHPCLGPTMALRRGLLEEIGGFPYLSDFLADDYELGRAVRERGHRLAFAPGLIEHLCPERSAREMLTHEFRWARTVRLIEPAGYFGSGITHFWVLALIGMALTGFAGWSVITLATLTLLRLALVALTSRFTGANLKGLALTPFRDLLSFGVFVGAFFGDRVEWRGAQLQLGRTGEVTIC
ncbi:MAG: bacteriohopanetetrol glucosamine biosynthesis glycosyltransferase HpnI [Caulobacteraceae bacterium]|nr:bacteriohopanetetrol glucosamine biosynthesis glycosyltransferase HpnI [Caulobacteraceae bacterium]